jgi:glycerol-3-phosphate dehydrogenase (NAD(P)+)
MALARRRGVEMPICEQMEILLYHGKDPRRAVEELMSRELKAEGEEAARKQEAPRKRR